MAVSLDQFRRQLVESNLMAIDDIDAILAGVPPNELPKDADQLARLLVGRQELTPYQAEQLCSGEGKSLVLGKYEVVDKLGQGGMGLVLKAVHRRMDRTVALKVLSPKVTNNPEAVRRFQREVKAAAKLEHPNIVTAYDADEAGGIHFLVMQYVAGADLAALVRQQGPLPVRQAVTYVCQAARGLAYAHAHGVIHRDVKPSNLLVDADGTVKILDMGLARLESAGADQDQITGTGEVMGTVDYMAPEQAMETKTADERADVYSLGVTLWYLLTGRPLYPAKTLVKRLLAHQTSPIPSLRDACPQVSGELGAVFAKMVAKDPSDRFQTMTEVIVALNRCAAPADTTHRTVAAAGDVDRPSESVRRAVSSSRPSLATEVPATRNDDRSTSDEPTVAFQSQQYDTNPKTARSVTNPLAAARSWNGRAAWIAGCVVAVALLLIAIAYFRQANSNPASVATNVPTAAPSSRVVPLIPFLKSEHLAEGSWQDVKIDGDVVTFDASHRQSQIWHDFHEVVGADMTLRTGLRVSLDDKGGYVKLVFLVENEPDYFFILTNYQGRSSVCIESSAGKELTAPAPWPGAAGDFTQAAIVMSAGRLQIQVAGKTVGDIPFTPGVPRSVALSVDGYKCEFREPEIVFHTQPPSGGAIEETD
jgi:serine/threonine protein kinase